MHHNLYHNLYHKFDHNCGLGVQGKLSWRTWHYLRCAGEAIAAYLALSKDEGREEGRSEGRGREGGREGVGEEGMKEGGRERSKILEKELLV